MNGFRDGAWYGIADDKIRGCVLRSRYHDGSLYLSTLCWDPEPRARMQVPRLLLMLIADHEESKGKPVVIFDSWDGNATIQRRVHRLGGRILQKFDDPDKRPEGVRSVVYSIGLEDLKNACNRLDSTDESA